MAALGFVIFILAPVVLSLTCLTLQTGGHTTTKCAARASMNTVCQIFSWRRSLLHKPASRLITTYAVAANHSSRTLASLKLACYWGYYHSVRAFVAHA